MQSRIKVTSVSGSPRGPWLVRLVLGYEGRQAEIEFHVPGALSDQKQDDGGIEAELRKVMAALREVFRGKDPKVPCMLKTIEGEAARAVALAENFAREPMHPSDEAEAFAGLAKDDGKGAGEVTAGPASAAVRSPTANALRPR